MDGQLARYDFRVAWCSLPETVAERFVAFSELPWDGQPVDRPGFAALKEIKNDPRSVAANWDAIDCIERLFGGHLIVTPAD